MTTLQGIGIFAGLPAAILLLIALPLYGGRWYRRLTRRPSRTGRPAERKPAAPDGDHDTT
jgi:hypothetical protein